MPAKKPSKKASASKQSASKKGDTKKGSSKKRSAAKSQIRKTAAKVLAGAAAGAVRALIPPLEEAAGTSEEAAGLNRQGGNKGRKSTTRCAASASRARSAMVTNSCACPPASNTPRIVDSTSVGSPSPETTLSTMKNGSESAGLIGGVIFCGGNDMVFCNAINYEGMDDFWR